jgi:hypothetical protein
MHKFPCNRMDAAATTLEDRNITIHRLNISTFADFSVYPVYPVAVPMRLFFLYVLYMQWWAKIHLISYWLLFVGQ